MLCSALQVQVMGSAGTHGKCIVHRGSSSAGQVSRSGQAQGAPHHPGTSVRVLRASLVLALATVSLAPGAIRPEIGDLMACEAHLPWSPILDTSCGCRGRTR